MLEIDSLKDLNVINLSKKNSKVEYINTIL